MGNQFYRESMFTVQNLTCESLVNPLGLAVMNPRFSWHIESDIPGTVQQGYCIELMDEDGLVWNSGEIVSAQSVLADYTGQPLAYATRYTWRVKVCVNDIWSNWSKPAWFETTLEKWEAPFICADDRPEDSYAVVFRREIHAEKPLKSARLYASALGLYEIFIGDKQITDTCFNPGWSAYDFRVLFQTFDVTDMLTSGIHTLTAHVAAGWFKGDLGFEKCRNLYGSTMAFSAHLHLVYTDGSCQTILTGDDWQFCASPIIYSEIYHGETYDARLESPDTWQSARILEPGSRSVEPFDGLPVRRQEVLPPIALFTTPGGDRVLDFGRNITGRVRFSVNGQAADRVKLRHAEVLDHSGNFYTENLRSAKCTDTYILKGGATEVYEPYFTFHGFRYVAVDEYPGEIHPGNFEAVVIHSDMERTGTFACSHPLINQLHSNIVWGWKGNALDIPTDCPQRDERLGWTGDIQIFASTACFLYNTLPFLVKWLHDLRLEQRPDGGVPHVIPDVLKKLNNDSHSACGWGDAAVIVPWTLYECFGDIRVLEDQYDSMCAWISRIHSQASGNIWNTGNHFADWVALDAKEGDYIGATPPDLCATAYYAYSTGLVAKTAEILGRSGDAEQYRKLHADIVTAYQREFFTPSGRLAAQTQTAHILSLVFALTPQAFIPRTIDTLVKLIEQNSGHMVTGFLGTPYFCHALSRNNKLNEAYALLLREDYPSWLYQVTMGATTVWEHLDGIKPDGSMWSANMNSFNHYAYGAVGDWLHKVVAGISPLEAGYKRILIAPQPGGSLTWAQAALKTPYGMVASRWEYTDGSFSLKVTIPANTSAEIVLPDKRRFTVGSGEYTYQ